MQETTIDHRKQELRQLLDEIANHPERDHREHMKRVAVLKEMIAEQEAAEG